MVIIKYIKKRIFLIGYNNKNKNKYDIKIKKGLDKNINDLEKNIYNFSNNHLNIPFEISHIILNLNCPTELETNIVKKIYPNLPKGINKSKERLEHLRELDKLTGGFRYNN